MSIVALTLAAEEESTLAAVAFGAADYLFEGLNNSFYIAAAAIGAGGLYSGFQIDKRRGSGILKKTEDVLSIVPLHSTPPKRPRSGLFGLDTISGRRSKTYVQEPGQIGATIISNSHRRRKWHGRRRRHTRRRAATLAVVL